MSVAVIAEVPWQRNAARWTDVCAFEDLTPERGVAALVAGEQVAVFRTHDGVVRAVGNRDPFSGAHVLSRGIVGSVGSVPVVANPLFKQHFDLRTGVCLEDAAVTVPVYLVRVFAGRVQVGRAWRGS